MRAALRAGRPRRARSLPSLIDHSCIGERSFGWIRRAIAESPRPTYDPSRLSAVSAKNRLQIGLPKKAPPSAFGCCLRDRTSRPPCADRSRRRPRSPALDNRPCTARGCRSAIRAPVHGQWVTSASSTRSSGRSPAACLLERIQETSPLTPAGAIGPPNRWRRGWRGESNGSRQRSQNSNWRKLGGGPMMSDYCWGVSLRSRKDRHGVQVSFLSGWPGHPAHGFT